MEKTTKRFIYKNGTYIEERVELMLLLRWLYEQPSGTFFRRLFIRRWLSSLGGWFASLRVSSWFIASFVKKHAISLQDFYVPAQGYRSFNDFFIRRLKPGARCVNKDSTSIIAPADSKVLVIPQLASTNTFFVKSLPFSIASFLGCDALSAYYDGGTLCIFRLAPYDYHWFHMPFDGVVGRGYEINGCLDSVNPAVYDAGIVPLITNKRYCMPCVTSGNQQHTVMLVAVGAMMVGEIVPMYTSEKVYKKGAELGYFSFGGSTVVMLVPPGICTVDELLVQNSHRGIETVVKMGDAVGQWIA